MEEMILAVVLLLIAAGLMIIAVFSFREKGFLLNNAYIYASPDEREQMDKKPYYRQSAWVFLCLSLSFVLMGAALFIQWEWMYTLAGISTAVAAVYATVSSIQIGKNRK